MKFECWKRWVFIIINFDRFFLHWPIVWEFSQYWLSIDVVDLKSLQISLKPAKWMRASVIATSSTSLWLLHIIHSKTVVVDHSREGALRAQVSISFHICIRLHWNAPESRVGDHIDNWARNWSQSKFYAMDWRQIHVDAMIAWRFFWETKNTE